MVKRTMLALTFVAAVGVASLGLSNTAEAGGCHRGGGRGFYNAYYGPAPYYGYAPRVRRVYYGPPAYYGPGPGYISYGRYGRHSAFSFSLGF